MKLNESGMSKCIRFRLDFKINRSSKELFETAEDAARVQLKDKGYVLVDYMDFHNPSPSLRLEKTDFVV
jgi:hypothetical protein